jgi:hypothetical protein
MLQREHLLCGQPIQASLGLTMGCRLNPVTQKLASYCTPDRLKPTVASDTPITFVIPTKLAWEFRICGNDGKPNSRDA